MNFSLTEEQNLILDLARQFADRAISPLAAQADRDKNLPLSIHQQALELGLINLTLPAEYGGAGLGCMEVALVTEQLCRACLGIGAALSVNTLAIEPVLLAGSEAQKRLCAERLLAGEFASFALTEPGAGSDVTAIRTQARRVSGGYELSGSKIWISNASLASFFVVFAKTDSASAHQAMSAFIVERDAAGLSIGKPLDKMGQRAAPACEVFFDQVFVAESSRLGAEGNGFELAMRTFDRSRPMVAAFGLGLTQRCVEEATAYALERTSMGKRLIDHQVIAHRLADMQIRLEASRLLTWQAAWLADMARRNTSAASIAKAFTSDAAMWAATETVQIFGAMGYSTEYPAEKLFRDAKVLQIYEGTSEIQRNIIARTMANA